MDKTPGRLKDIFMKIKSWIVVLILCTSVGGLAQSTNIALYNVSVIPMDKNRTVKNQTILISNGKIVNIGNATSLKIPVGFQKLDCSGYTVLPGLADMHMHLRRASYDSMMSYLRLGITTLRDMNGRPFILQWKDSIEKGLITGPHLYVASPSIGNFSSAREGFPTPKNSRQADSLILAYKNAGYDYIKVHNFITDTIYDAITKYSRKHNMEVVGHVPVGISLQHAIFSGQKTIEHFTGFADCCMDEDSRRKDSIDYRAIFHAVHLNKDSLHQYISMMVEKKIWSVPTITFFDRILPAPMVKDAFADPSLRKQGLTTRKQILYELHKKGALIMMGTDSDAGEDLEANTIYDELQYMNEAGLTPYEVLRTATVLPAAYLGLSAKKGKVMKGMDADLVIVKGNPLENLQELRNVIKVMINGKIVVNK